MSNLLFFGADSFLDVNTLYSSTVTLSSSISPSLDNTALFFDAIALFPNAGAQSFSTSIFFLDVDTPFFNSSIPSSSICLSLDIATPSFKIFLSTCTLRLTNFSPLLTLSTFFCIP